MEPNINSDAKLINDDDSTLLDLFGASVVSNSELSNSLEPKDPVTSGNAAVFEVLTTKLAVEYLVNGTLKKKVCRYCLKVVPALSELDQVLQVGGGDVLYKVTIREMIASIHPIKVVDDPNFPNRICEDCVDRTLSSYLFKQQCERSERALRNCFDDIFEKLEKLDPMEKQKKRGRQKLNPNPNKLYTEHRNVIDYAEPLIALVNISSVVSDIEVKKFTCSKCCEVFPSLQLLMNHEKIHPKSMWHHCHVCGRSFVKQFHLRRHIQFDHAPSKPRIELPTHFKCLECGALNQDHITHMQHIEKHKFKVVMEHLVTRKIDKLCAVCFNKGPNFVEMDNMVRLHGGYPEMMGDMTIYSILGSTVPEMNVLHNYTGSKICDKCLNNAITSFVFIHHTRYIRNRLNVCINSLLQNLNKDDLHNDLFIEISPDLIMPKYEQYDENLILENMDELDETKLKIDVLEDEFRVESESDSEESTDEKDIRDEVEDTKNKVEDTRDDAEDMKDYLDDSSSDIFNFNEYLTVYKSFDKPIETYSRRAKRLNGINSVKETKLIDDVCSEFLTFKKKKISVKPKKRCKYTCPVCNKHFISNYFLRRHVLKHVFRKSFCLQCGLTFKSKFYLYEHTKVHHLMKQNGISCETCGRTFLNKSKLNLHEKCHGTKECILCNKKFVSQMHYDCHLQRHAPKLGRIRQKSVQNCSFCEKECANDNDLSVHVNKVHLQIKPYSCDMCDRQFYTEFNLSHHKKVHVIPSKETCEFCSKNFRCRRDLVIHIRKHIDSRPHSCPICEHSFHSQNKMETHLKVLHGGKFLCKFCKTVFSTKNDLKIHMSIVHRTI